MTMALLWSGAESQSGPYEGPLVDAHLEDEMAGLLTLQFLEPLATAGSLMMRLHSDRPCGRVPAPHRGGLPNTCAG